MSFLLPKLCVCSAVILALSSIAIAQDTISTDRPGLTTSPNLMPAGRFQAELGIPTLTLTRGNGVETDAWNSPLQLRYGLASSFELRLSSPMYSIVRDEKANDTIQGFGDVELGAKVALCEAAGPLPKTSLVGGVRFPVGDDDFTSNEAGYDINLAASWDLGSGNSLCGFAGVVRTPVGGDDALTGNFAVSGCHTFTPKTAGYVDAGYFPGFQNADDQAFAGTGLTYLVTNDLQVDVSGEFGLNDDSPDAIVGLGISWRH